MRRAAALDSGFSRPTHRFVHPILATIARTYEAKVKTGFESGDTTAWSLTSP